MKNLGDGSSRPSDETPGGSGSSDAPSWNLEAHPSFWGAPADADPVRCRRVRGIVMDVTERKLAEMAVKEIDRRFARLAIAAPVMIWTSGTDKLCDFSKRAMAGLHRPFNGARTRKWMGVWRSSGGL
jgi:PAS domain-containing protein